MKKHLIIILAITVLFTTIWFYFPLRSYLIMSVYSHIHEIDSIMAMENFKIDIPGGIITPERDWYPFVITYNSSYFNGRAGSTTDMSIMYNFPAFDIKTRTSTFYNPASPLCSAFYGAYVIKTGDDIPYGFYKSGLINYDEIVSAVKYDYTRLVLDSLGCENAVFKTIEYRQTKSDYLGYDNWILINSEILSNSVVHNFTENKRSYLQYGRPTASVDSDFDIINIFARIYVRYFEEYDCTIFMYIMAPDIDALNKCDKLILSKSMITNTE